MITTSELASLLSAKRYDAVEAAGREALSDPLARSALLHAIYRGLARATGQKGRLQALAGAVDTALRSAPGGTEVVQLRWSLMKEAVKAGATPSTTEGFHRLFENALQGAYPGAPSLNALLGRFKFREAKEPLDGLQRMERAEKWLPFEVGRCFFMPGHGAGRVVETNFALDAVRLDFERSKGVAVPIGVASKSLAPLLPGHFLFDKLTEPAELADLVQADPPWGLKRLLDSFGKALTLAEVKEAFQGLVPDERWNGFWTAARKDPHVLVHGSGKSATVGWSETVDGANDVILARFERAVGLREKLEFFRKHGKRDPVLALRMASRLAEEAKLARATDAPLAYEAAVQLCGVEGADPGFSPEELVPADPLPFLTALPDRLARERLLDSLVGADAAAGARLMAEWFFREEDSRTLDLIDKRLLEADPALREAMFERLLKSPRSGPRAFVWYAQRAALDETFRSRLTASAVARLLDALSWDDVGASRSRLREQLDRGGLAAIWLVKQATLPDAEHFLQALSRHNDLEPHRRRALVAAAEMRFPELRKKGLDEAFYVTPEALEAKRLELDRLLKVEIPENTDGIRVAASEGDLSENFEYKARREKAQLLSARAGQLQEALTLARPLDASQVDASEVRPGTRVTLMADGAVTVVTLLGPWDSNPEAGVYSYLAEVGKALLGRHEGDHVTWKGEAAVIERIESWI